MRIIIAFFIVVFVEVVMLYGIELFDNVFKLLWKGICVY